MILFISLTIMLSIIALFCSFLAYALGNYILCDWTSWMGWYGMITAGFIIVGLAIKKAINTIFPYFLNYFETKATEKFYQGRRRFLSYSLNISITVISSALSIHGLSEAVSPPRIKTVEIKIQDLPQDLEGFTIVQISDLHISPVIRRNYVQSIVKNVNSLSPDIIALTGDIVDGTYAEIHQDVAPLKGLSARYGKFFVTGNHEYMCGVEEWIKEMGKMGFTVLLNDHRIIQQGQSRMLVGGVVDYSASSIYGHVSDPVKAMGTGYAADVKILLAHQPQSVYSAAEAGFDLQLSGHTHGGQVTMGSWIDDLTQPFLSGLYKYKNMQIYVSNGAGYWGLPVRYGAPSEITHIKLMAS